MPRPWTRQCEACGWFLPSAATCRRCAAGRTPPLTGHQKHKRFIEKMRAGGRIERPFKYRDGRTPRWDVAMSLQEDGLTYAEIGKRMGITRQGARCAVKYGLIRLHLERQLPAQGGAR